MAKLLLNNGSGPAQELSLNAGSNRIGRNSANDIQIEHASVSSFHCEITCAGTAITVKDLGSTNGTFLEGRPIQEAAAAHGQRVQFGLVEVILDAPELEPVAALAAVPAGNAQAQVAAPVARIYASCDSRARPLNGRCANGGCLLPETRAMSSDH